MHHVCKECSCELCEAGVEWAGMYQPDLSLRLFARSELALAL